MGPSSLKHAANDAAIVGSAYFNDISLFDPFAIDEKTLGADGSRGHLGHGDILDLNGKLTRRL
jgi:hypothetical protein